MRDPLGILVAVSEPDMSGFRIVGVPDWDARLWSIARSKGVLKTDEGLIGNRAGLVSPTKLSPLSGAVETSSEGMLG